MRNLSSLFIAVLFFLFFGFLAQAADLSECININTAPKEELEKIVHIGPARAEQIIKLREQKLFSSVDDLERVKGIGPSRLADIKEQGLACVDEPQPEPNALSPQTNKPHPEEPGQEFETTSAPKVTSAEELVKTRSLPIIYPSGVIINEILPSPTGPDAEEEWIEIFNQNGFEVDLSGWQIADIEGVTKTYTFPEGTKIGPKGFLKGFLVLSRPTTKITLNNSGDGLNLFQPDGKIIDSVSYEKAPRGQSYNRINSKWVWSTTLTPGSANIIPAPIEEAEPSQEEIKALAPEKEIEEALPKKELAAIGEQISKKTPFLPFLIALTLAIFSGIIILILKRKTY